MVQSKLTENDLLKYLFPTYLSLSASIRLNLRLSPLEIAFAVSLNTFLICRAVQMNSVILKINCRSINRYMYRNRISFSSAIIKKFYFVKTFLCQYRIVYAPLRKQFSIPTIGLNRSETNSHWSAKYVQRRMSNGQPQPYTE